jgi:hypothetical protein
MRLQAFSQVAASSLPTFALALLLLTGGPSRAQPLAVHPQNPHYFLYGGKPTVLVGSTEHYGAVINADFDYRTYLRTLAQDGLNTTRLFTGAYFEVPGAFGIANNTLAPKPGRLILPWARSNAPGYALGGNKFDLGKWNGAYFDRLKDFMAEANRQGVIVEVCLFSSYYGAGWPHSPFNAANNVNNLPKIETSKANTLDNGGLLRHQEAYVRKLVQELNGFDNFYFEIQNEPWADLTDTVLVYNEYVGRDDLKEPGNFWKNTLQVVAKVANDWQRHVAGVIRSEEGRLPKKHLVSQNVANFQFPLAEVDPNVAVVNFHYAAPTAVGQNYHLGKVIGFNETGFAGKRDETYRRQAWRFLLAGGALFDHLDYSFSVGSENGRDTSYVAPGGGSPALRKQFGILKTFMHSLDLAGMRPQQLPLKSARGAFVQGMGNGKGQYALYAEGIKGFALVLELPAGDYEVEWMHPVTGQKTAASFTHAGGEKVITAPVGLLEAALKISKK